MSVGTRIKELRLERNMTQKDFAKEIGISRSYLGDLENDRKSPSAETIHKLSEKMNVSSSYFFDNEKKLSENADNIIYITAIRMYLSKLSEFQLKKISIYDKYLPKLSSIHTKDNDDMTQKILSDLERDLSIQYSDFYKGFTPLGRKLLKATFNPNSVTKSVDENALENFIFSLDIEDLVALFQKDELLNQLKEDRDRLVESLNDME